MITITLQQIMDAELYSLGWRKVLSANGPDLEKQFPVSSILDSNGLDDCLWVLRCLPEYDNLWRKFACWCALENIELIKPYCADADYSLILDYLNNPDAADASRSDAVDTADDSRSDVDTDAAYSAADAAYSAAAYDTARAVYSAADSAADSASDSAAERKKQADKLREILDAGEWIA